MGDLEIGNIQLTNNNGQTLLLADVTNIGKTSTKMKFILITLVDKNGNEIARVKSAIAPINSGEKKKLNASTQTDCVNAYDFKISEI